MRDSNVFIGRVVEIRRFVVPIEAYMPTDNRERWDLWVKASDGSERQFVITSRSMPTRRGHCVALAMHGADPVGIVNLTTGARLNLAGTNPNVLFFPWELFVAGVFLLLLPLANLYFPMLMAIRGMTDSFSGTRAEAILDQIEKDFDVRSRQYDDPD